jgi:hypothetical protein
MDGPNRLLNIIVCNSIGLEMVVVLFKAGFE